MRISNFLQKKRTISKTEKKKQLPYSKRVNCQFKRLRERLNSKSFKLQVLKKFLASQFSTTRSNNSTLRNKARKLKKLRELLCLYSAKSSKEMSKTLLKQLSALRLPFQSCSLRISTRRVMLLQSSSIFAKLQTKKTLKIQKIILISPSLERLFSVGNRSLMQTTVINGLILTSLCSSPIHRAELLTLTRFYQQSSLSKPASLT